MPKNDQHLIWLDLEMTGLDVKQDKIIEMATIITNVKLDIIAEGPVIAIHQSDETLNKMDDWNTLHHTQSGLVKRVQDSEMDELMAESETLKFIGEYVPPKQSPICGNSICQDRRFLARHMPKLEHYFHYRNLDVTTIKILAKHWAPKVAEGLTKVPEHLALQDIRDSIEELRYYRKHFFRISD